MKLLTVKTLWGVTPLMGNAPGRYADVFARIKSDGFGAIETPIWKIEDPASFAAALKSTGLDYVAMVNTRTPENLPGSHALTRSVDAHLASFEAQIRQALTSLPGVRPLFVNSHSGVDAWGPADARAFFDGALRIEKEMGIMVCHETHRGRVLYNPWAARDLCAALPDLKLTADLSHFCVVAERVFSDDDEDWAEVMAQVARATKHIHARVGYAQGPQVNDPRAPEHATALHAHERWWDAIIKKQAELGGTVITLEPEHGTDGYQQKLPFSTIETADIWEINKWMVRHVWSSQAARNLFVQLTHPTPHRILTLTARSPGEATRRGGLMRLGRI
jgi:sugar phosphate isomerase/epimerase